MKTILTAFLAAIAHATTYTLDYRQDYIASHYDKNVLEFHVGDVLDVSMASNPTTGYSWIVNKESQDHFSVISDKYKSDAV